ncbi:L,D-transpeptidase family protein [Paracoccus sp. (in: a-proteobacteria)]|uniref:L,D-transpeptidase family protein n=1 Tax=Paracoccus sp. TaxID=267 RepID=UPI003A864317
MRRFAALFSLLTLVLLLVAAGLLMMPRHDAPLPGTALTGPVDRILIEKSVRRMTAFREGQALKTWRIALGFSPQGDKRMQGDGKTPEGVFHINRRNASSAYHLSLGIDYPRPKDRARAAAQGVDPGGDIFIHGQPNQLPDAITLPHDWTAGCIAVSNAEIRELFAATATGTEVEIRP